MRYYATERRISTARTDEGAARPARWLNQCRPDSACHDVPAYATELHHFAGQDDSSLR
jgi:hypothetical protein